MHKIVTCTLRELFDKTWEIPVLRLARETGVSDVALAKACRKAGIALPGSGYWAKPERPRPLKPRLLLREARLAFVFLIASGYLPKHILL